MALMVVLMPLGFFFAGMITTMIRRRPWFRGPLNEQGSGRLVEAFYKDGRG
jgi:hypothetical protein